MEFIALFHAPMYLAVRFPAAPFVIAAAFAVGQWALMRRHGWTYNVHMWRRPLLFACAIWLVYGLYEMQVQATWHTGNIRIDLLVLSPILYVFSAVGLWWLKRCWDDPSKAVVQQAAGDAEATKLAPVTKTEQDRQS